MGSPLRYFVKRFGSRRQDIRSERVFIAAFGKHPGWDDHIEDIGLETDSLVRVKRLLYVQGIGGNIDSGSWDKLRDDHLVEEFRHVFLWCIDGNLVVGRIWSSCDGKGRTSYPMVACAQCRNLRVPWVFGNILPRLEKVEASCIATTSAADVKMIIENARQELRRLAQQCQSSSDLTVTRADALAMLADRPELGPNHEGLLRVLYHIEREVERHGNSSAKGKALRPTLLRVPAGAATTLESATLWGSLFVSKFGLTTPVLGLVPLEGDWMDIIVGEPTESQLYCLRTPLSVIPLTTSIPYNMGCEFIDRTNELIAKSRTYSIQQNSHDTG